MTRTEKMARGLVAGGREPSPLEVVRPTAPVLTAATVEIAIVYPTVDVNKVCFGFTSQDEVRLRHSGAPRSASALLDDRLAQLVS